jgi:hypothetical protein
MRIAIGLAALVVAFPSWAAQQPSDAEIRQAIVRASIASYSGNCPCPYNVDRAGRSCGRRSAYTRPGGATPICYPDDVTQAMIDRYRATHK